MKKTCKTYVENGVTYQFDANSLMMYINRKKAHGQRSGHKITQAAIREELADMAFVSQEAVKNWMYGNNAPSDIEQVKVIAEYFNIDHHKLLTKMEEKEMTTATENVYGKNSALQQEYSRNLVRTIYHNILALIGKINYYQSLDITPESFNTEETEKLITEGRWDMLKELSELEDQLHKGLLDIPVSVYNKIDAYICGKLTTCVEAAAPSFLIGFPTEKIEHYMEDNSWVFDYTDDNYWDDLRTVFAEYIVTE